MKRALSLSLPVRLLILAVLSLAMVLASWAVLGQGNFENSDVISFYRPTAENIMAGRGYTIEREGRVRPGDSFPPGFPIVLAGTYTIGRAFGLSDDASEAILTLACAAATSLLLYGLARLFWGEVGFVAALGWAMYPVGLWISLQTNSESAFMVALMGALLMLYDAVMRQRGWRHLRVFGAGMLFGAAVLIRPFSLGVVFGAALSLFWLARALPVRTRAWLAVLLIAGQVAIMLPWQVWASISHERLILLDAWHGARDLRYGLTFNLLEERGGPAVPGQDAEPLKRELEQAGNAIEGDAISGLGGWLMVVGGRFVRDASGTILFFADRLVQSWYGTVSGRQQGLLIAIQLVYIPIFALSAWRARRDWRLLLMVLGFFGYFYLVAVLTYQMVRYLLPGIAFLFLLAPALIPAGWAQRFSRAPQPAAIDAPMRRSSPLY